MLGALALGCRVDTGSKEVEMKGTMSMSIRVNRALLRDLASRLNAYNAALALKGEPMPSARGTVNDVARILQSLSES